MTRDEWLKQERAASRAFMDTHANEDFELPPGAVSYDREYVCGACGFATRDPGEIWDHRCEEEERAQHGGTK